MKQETKTKYDIRLGNVRKEIMHNLPHCNPEDVEDWQDLFKQFQETQIMLMDEKGGTIVISNAIQTLESRVYRKINNITDGTEVILNPTDPEDLDIDEVAVNTDRTHEDMMGDIGAAMTLLMGVYQWAIKRVPLASEVDAIKALKTRTDDIKVTQQAFSKLGGKL